MTSERRKYARSDFPVDAVAYTGNVVVRCRLENLSLGGAALSTKTEVGPGSFLRLHFPVGPGAVVDADAVVVRSVAHPGAFVWGVTFVGLDAVTAERIRGALANPPKPDAISSRPPSASGPRHSSPAPSGPRHSAPAPSQPRHSVPAMQKSSAPPSRRSSVPAAAAVSKRELQDLFKEALEQLDETKKR
jgi:hypothetical protein